MEKILLFIPAYNCEKQITRVLDQIHGEARDFISEVIVINNRSTDNTEAVVRNYAYSHGDLNLRLLRNRDNYNLGGSHKVAFKYAIDKGFDYVIILHGDDQGSIADMLPVLRSGRHRERDCMLGARFKPGSKLMGYSKFRTFGNKVYNSIFSLLLGKRIYDLGSGLNLYSVDMLKDGFYMKFPDRLTFNYCMVMAADYYDHDIEFFPISWREDDQVSNVKMTSQAINVLSMLFKYVIDKKGFIKSEHRENTIEEYRCDDVTDGGQ